MFSTGEIVPTKLALKRAASVNLDLLDLIMNHSQGNWVNLTKTERELNYLAMGQGRPIFSRYSVHGQVFLLTTDQKEDKTYIKIAEEM